MARLTNRPLNPNSGFEDLMEMLAKLNHLEDIEDKIGIDLITLFKATFNGIYYITNGNIINTKDMGFSVAFCKDYLLIIDTEIEHSYRIEDYGKTWALTKEELENDIQ